MYIRLAPGGSIMYFVKEGKCTLAYQMEATYQTPRRLRFNTAENGQHLSSRVQVNKNAVLFEHFREYSGTIFTLEDVKLTLYVLT